MAYQRRVSDIEDYTRTSRFYSIDECLSRIQACQGSANRNHEGMRGIADAALLPFVSGLRTKTANVRE